MTKTKSTAKRTLRKPVVFLPIIEDKFDLWADSLRYDPDRLRKASLKAVRTRHHEAFINHPSERANDRQPNIYTLAIPGGNAVYSDEPQAMVIRGYTYQIYRKPLDDFDGGFHITDYEWHPFLTPTGDNETA
jgi:hypothetical protein